LINERIPELFHIRRIPDGIPEVVKKNAIEEYGDE